MILKRFMVMPPPTDVRKTIQASGKSLPCVPILPFFPRPLLVYSVYRVFPVFLNPLPAAGNEVPGSQNTKVSSQH